MSIKRFFSLTTKALHATGSTIPSSATGFNPTAVPISNAADALAKARSSKPRSDWTKEEISEIYNAPLMDLIFNAQLKHREYQRPSEVQLCTLVNIKQGGCTENCSYCSQSSKHDTGVAAEKLDLDAVMEIARDAKARGGTRVCLGSAWRDMQGRKSALAKISKVVKQINEELKLETCVTLGMINEKQAEILKENGLTAYNHNIDTSREHYPNVVTTRTYDERLDTIKNVQKAGIKACTGGILGLGETAQDHVSFLYTLSNMTPHPESLPINRLVPIKGTPIVEVLKNAPKERQLEFDAILRTIATARLIMPESIIRLAAGRYTMKEHEQFLCFMSGVNAIFTGKRMLTTMCNGWDEDIAMLKKWGLKPMESFTNQ